MTIQRPNWRIALFSAAFLSLFLWLGFWQLERAGEKREMLAIAEQQANSDGKEVTSGDTVVNGDMITSSGEFTTTPVFYLDNKVLDGRVGYEVVQLFKGDNGTNYLVNRGFVAGGLTRDDLPDVPRFNRATQRIRGQAYLTELSEPEENITDGHPTVIQVIKPDSLSERLGLTLFTHTLRLHESHPDALPRHWPVTTMSPDRHLGYALTWFSMAIAIMIAFAMTVIKRQTPSEG